jgi:putative redox protein
METLIDKSKELRGTVKLINDRVLFEGNVSGNQPVMIDYVPPLGDNLGYTSLELLLLSLSSCVGTAILAILRKMQKGVSGFEISSVGQRKEEHPTGFRSIHLEVNLQSDHIETADMDKVIKLIEGICPLLSMLKGNVEITYAYQITR